MACVVIEPAEANEIAPLKPGDGVVFDAADWRSPEEPEEGGRVFQVTRRDGKLELRVRQRRDSTRAHSRGDLVWRTHDPDLDKAVRPYIDPAAPVRQAGGRGEGDGAGRLAVAQ